MKEKNIDSYLFFPVGIGKTSFFIPLTIYIFQNYKNRNFLLPENLKKNNLKSETKFIEEDEEENSLRENSLRENSLRENSL